MSCNDVLTSCCDIPQGTPVDIMLEEGEIKTPVTSKEERIRDYMTTTDPNEIKTEEYDPTMDVDNIDTIGE